MIQTTLPAETAAAAIVDAEVADVWARSCPLCAERLPRSEHLRGVFAQDPYAEWAANLVTHYRHEHVGYYDRALHSAAYRAAMGPRTEDEFSYDAFKVQVNNRAKRQLIRGILAASMPLREKYALIGGFRKLQGNDTETDALVTVALSRRGMRP